MIAYCEWGIFCTVCDSIYLTSFITMAYLKSRPALGLDLDGTEYPILPNLRTATPRLFRSGI